MQCGNETPYNDMVTQCICTVHVHYIQISFAAYALSTSSKLGTSRCTCNPTHLSDWLLFLKSFDGLHEDALHCSYTTLLCVWRNLKLQLRNLHRCRVCLHHQPIEMLLRVQCNIQYGSDTRYNCLVFPRMESERWERMLPFMRSSTSTQVCF